MAESRPAHHGITPSRRAAIPRARKFRIASRTVRQPPAGTPALLATNVSRCLFSYQTLNQLNAMITLELSRKISVSVGSNAAATLRNPCTAQGFASFDLATFEVSIVNIPGAGAFNASGASVSELNDYVYGANADPSRNNRADTLYVFDGVTSSSFRFDLPPDVQTFSNLIPIPEMNSVLGLATNRVAGDAGLIFFDLDLAASKLPSSNCNDSHRGLMDSARCSSRLIRETSFTNSPSIS